MNIRIKTMLAGTATVVVTAAILVAGAGAANAAVTPGWEPDSGALGAITFYNASGAVVTGGSLTASPSVAYAAATGAGRPGDAKAQLYMYTPQQGVAPANWSGDSLTGSTNFPNTGAPAPVKNLTVPVASGIDGDLTIDDVIGEFPNNSTVAGYQNLYQLRLVTVPAGIGSGTYYRVDIEVDRTAGTWTVVYPTGPASTATTLTASPASPAPHGSAVTLTAKVSPAAAGAVHFLDGTTDLGAGSYDAATGTATLAVNPSDGNHSFTAAFAPADTGSYQASTSAALSYTITGPSTPTTTTLASSPASPAAGDAGGNVNVTLTATVAPGGLSGSLHFFDGSTDLGVADTYTASTGVGTKAVVLNAAASPHYLTATFTPADPAYAKSTSAIGTYTVTTVNSGTAAIAVQAADNTPPYAGSLSLQVASGTKVALAQVDPSVDGGHPALAGDPTGHRHAWVFNGNLAGVAIQDTRPGQPGWTVTGQSSGFANGSIPIPAANLGWTPALVPANSDAEGSVAAGPIVQSLLAAAASKGLSEPVKLASAPAGAGLGTQNLGAAMELRIPDTSPTGTYTGTLTLTLVSP